VLEQLFLTVFFNLTVYLLILTFSSIKKDIFLGIEFSFLMIFTSFFISFILSLRYLPLMKFMIFIEIVVLLFYSYKNRFKILLFHNKIKTYFFYILGFSIFCNGLSTIWRGENADYFPNSSYRFADLAIDNALPAIAARTLSLNSIPNPLVPGWQLSDRPPLQIGALLNLTFGQTFEYGVYFAFSLGLQTLVLWVLLYWIMKNSMNKFKSHMILLIFSLTGLIVQNTIFPWPKLFGASFGILAIAILYFAEFKLNFWNSVKISLLMTASILSHNSHIFYFLALMIFLFVLYLLKSRQQLLYLIMISVLTFIFYTPWIYFQRVMQPPGTRLLKLQLAGITEESDRSFFSLLKEQYSNLDLMTWFTFKLNNIGRSFLPYIDPNIPYNFGEMKNFSTGFSQTVGFFIPYNNLTARVWQISELAILSVSLIWIFFWLIIRGMSPNTKELNLGHFKQNSIYMFIVSILSYILWIILMFSPRSTVIWQGTLILPLMLYLLTIIPLVKTLSKVSIISGIVLQTILFFNIWLRRPISIYLNYAFDTNGLVLLIIGICVIVFSLWLSTENVKSK
jgi:hypothetical protein